MKYLLIAIFFFTSTNANAQYTNEVCLPYFGSSFLNGYPYKLNRHILENGIKYKKAIGKEKTMGVFFQLANLTNDYLLKSKEVNEQNTYIYSESAFASIGYYNRFFSTKYFMFDALVGLNYKFVSTNLLLVKYYPSIGEAILQNVYYNNSFGAMLGFDINIPIYKHLSATVGISYSRFFNNQTIRSKYDGTAIKDPQRNTLVTGFGLTYGFGKKKR